jgi:hypothetical protein
MMTFPCYATGFQIQPQDGAAFKHLSPLLNRLQQVRYSLQVDDPSANQGQMTSSLDTALEQSLLALGAQSLDLPLPPAIPQEMDFAFTYDGRKVAVEIEKSNREKILRDILKCHMYLHVGADFSVVALPVNYPHTHGVWNLFEFGVQRFRECQNYGFGTPDRLSRILLIGFEQFEAATNEALSSKSRARMRKLAAAGASN